MKTVRAKSPTVNPDASDSEFGNECRKHTLPVTPRIEVDLLRSVVSRLQVSAKAPPALPLLPNTPFIQMVYPQMFVKTKTFAFTASDYPDGDEGKIFLPALILGTFQIRGLVLLSHGELNQMYITEFTYAMDDIGALLAGLGFVCISIRPRVRVDNSNKPIETTPVQGTEDTYIRHLKHAIETLNSNNKLYLNGKPVVLVGHSQAGAAAARTGLRVKNDMPAGVKSIRALVSLGGTNGEVSDSPNTQPADTFLGLRGALDGDVPKIPPLTLLHYQRISPKDDKYFLWGMQFNHKQFLNLTKFADEFGYVWDNSPFGTKLLVRNAAQKLATANYIAMFLLWKIGGMTEYSTVFLGEKRVAFKSQDPKIQADFARMNVLPCFDRYRAKPLVSSYPSDVIFQQMLQDGGLVSNPAPFEPLKDLEDTCTGQTLRGFVAEWDLNKFNLPRIWVKCNQDVMTASVKAIEFHAVAIDTFDGGSAPVDCRVYFWSDPGNSISLMVPINVEHALITDWTLSCPSTIRIGIDRFGLTDITKAHTLVIDFSKSSFKRCRIAIAGFRIALS